MWDNRLQQQTNWMDCFVVAVYYAPQSDQEVYCFIHKMSHNLPMIHISLLYLSSTTLLNILVNRIHKRGKCAVSKMIIR